MLVQTDIDKQIAEIEEKLQTLKEDIQDTNYSKQDISAIHESLQAKKENKLVSAQTLASEKSLSDWNRKDEDRAWKHL